MDIFDTNHDVTPKTAQLGSLGVKAIMRYLGTGDKSITPNEARAIAAVGMPLCSIWEAWGDTKSELNGSLGASHAQQAAARAQTIGQPAGAAIYFAVDNDEGPNAIASRIIPYFTAVKSHIGPYAPAVYGCGVVCQALLDQGLVKYTMLANASGWSGYTSFKASGRWNILQALPKNILGLDSDPGTINPNNPDIGTFIPFGALVVPGTGTVPPPPPAPVTLARLQSALNLATGPIDTLDKLAQAVLAIRAFQRSRGLTVDGVPGEQTQGKL